MSFTVYVLEGAEGVRYKGITTDLKRRLRQHWMGHTKTTRRMRNLRVVYQETYSTRAEARKREVYLKSAAGRRFLQTLFSM